MGRVVGMIDLGVEIGEQLICGYGGIEYRPNQIARCYDGSPIRDRRTLGEFCWCCTQDFRFECCDYRRGSGSKT